MGWEKGKKYDWVGWRGCREWEGREEGMKGVGWKVESEEKAGRERGRNGRVGRKSEERIAIRSELIRKDEEE